MKIDVNRVKSCLTDSGSLSAEEIAGHLNLGITQENRKEVLRSVRLAARKVVDALGGSRENKNERGETLYEVQGFE